MRNFITGLLAPSELKLEHEPHNPPERIKLRGRTFDNTLYICFHPHALKIIMKAVEVPNVIEGHLQNAHYCYDHSSRNRCACCGGLHKCLYVVVIGSGLRRNCPRRGVPIVPPRNPSPRSSTHGVPETSLGLYSGETFTCGDNKVVPSSAINDDFADCTDGSDEPGTSAGEVDLSVSMKVMTRSNYE